ncbi:hypothetical protein Ciccas_004241 [Cichlidogyrus casuarinus]|uniref:Troponin I n=1 Tax=Cichlidogyrus casuarinus TaxID=1844966 RepID=A0ABD2QD08_9PLAT
MSAGRCQFLGAISLLQEKKRKEAEEASKKQRKPGQKRKGLGGLSPEKKRLLKQLIMQKAADEMKAEMKKRQEEKENYLKSKVQPLDIDGANESEFPLLASSHVSGQLESKVKQLYERLKALEGDKYDWEEKLRRQDFEINDLNIKVNDVKGKFVKPVLKKVSKTDLTLAKLDKKHTSSLGSMRTQLKSTGQNKFALDENPKEDKADWRSELKSKEEEEA